jgi:hypothetical protein
VAMRASWQCVPRGNACLVAMRASWQCVPRGNSCRPFLVAVPAVPSSWPSLPSAVPAVPSLWPSLPSLPRGRACPLFLVAVPAVPSSWPCLLSLPRGRACRPCTGFTMPSLVCPIRKAAGLLLASICSLGTHLTSCQHRLLTPGRRTVPRDTSGQHTRLVLRPGVSPAVEPFYATRPASTGC